MNTIFQKNRRLALRFALAIEDHQSQKKSNRRKSYSLLRLWNRAFGKSRFFHFPHFLWNGAFCESRFLHFLWIFALFPLLQGCQSSQPDSPSNSASNSIAPTPAIVAAPTQAPIQTAPPTPASRVSRLPNSAQSARPFAHAEAIYAVKTSQMVFALTFDDGPDPTWTPQVLALLKAYQVPATFFMVGSMVRAHPATALQVKAAGFPVANHSWSHPRTPKSPVREVERTDAILQKTFGAAPVLFRPPYGMLDNGLAQAARNRGEKVIIWSCLGADWDKNATSASIAAKVLRRAHPGGIALLHDGGGNRARTLAALPLIIETLQARGFQLVTVPQLLEMGAPAPKSALTEARTPVPIPARTLAPVPVPLPNPTPIPAPTSIPFSKAIRRRVS